MCTASVGDDCGVERGVASVRAEKSRDGVDDLPGPVCNGLARPQKAMKDRPKMNAREIEAGG